ncbi:hypothetical protein GGR26_002624 [Lewinella marina]|uniref:DUF4252 domain-containing protein n=1 Tax=Neolewinella marina TaxID=438751 RepID=A0A2G0CDA4_9BACT|nr:DUF4252 domain-containing protein [Neolewinella marina]NJB86847.1 hypothetical protein [Neolewinella marina]PHK97953.1 hypothetical protein CGL56_14160 [Neolewinella marina]
MLRLLLLCLCCCSAALVVAQEAVIKDFIKVHRRGEENVAVKVPGWLVGLASDVAATTTDDPAERVAFQLLGEVGTVRFVTYNNDDFPEPEDSVVNLLYVLERYKDFERWAEVRTPEGERVTLTVRYAREKIKDLVVVISEGERTTLAAARTDLTARELGKLVSDLQRM